MKKVNGFSKEQPSACDLNLPVWFEYVEDNVEERKKGLAFPNARDPYYGVEFYSREELEAFILRLRSAANQVWGADEDTRIL